MLQLCAVAHLHELWTVRDVAYVCNIAVSSSNCLVLNARMTNNDLERKQPWLKFKYYPSIYSEEPRKTMKNLSQDSWFRDWSLNLVPPKYEVGITVFRCGADRASAPQSLCVSSTCRNTHTHARARTHTQTHTHTRNVCLSSLHLPGKCQIIMGGTDRRYWEQMGYVC
jgi:hypothetical protein